MESNAMMWFRKGLRIHDNPALDHARKGSSFLFPVFVLDPRYLDPDPSAFSTGSALAGLNRIQFLLESLTDLDSSLRKLGSRLLVLRGDPVLVLPRILKDWKIGKLCFEFDTEPYSQARDNQVKMTCSQDEQNVNMWNYVSPSFPTKSKVTLFQSSQDFAYKCGIKVFSPISHTLFDPVGIIQKNGGKPPLTYQSFVKLAGEPPAPLAQTYSMLPPIGDLEGYKLSRIPTFQELGYMDVKQEKFSPFQGGESEALKRLTAALANKEWVANFEKPKGDPSAFLKPSTTVLSPYLKFGCLSSRYFYQCIIDIYKTTKRHTTPPVSLVGQLLWRDFFYTVAFGTPSFDTMKGNRICKQIPWRDDEELLVAWREGRTGYPWIDAIMMQLKEWGWMHHLARHSVACFLTRGDLFVHWEKGRDIFERLLIDSDWAINNGNWLWLSCSSFFYQYHRIYSPITFGKKYDPTGKYIRHFLPVLENMPNEYIYEPWTAPLSIQEKANCIIGRDYPKPVVDHATASKECKRLYGSTFSQEKLNSSRGQLEEDDQKEYQDTHLKQRKRLAK